MAGQSSSQTQTETLSESDLTDGPPQTFDDPHIKHINLVKEVFHPSVGKIKVVGPAVSYSYAQNCVRSPPPALGEHTKEVLKDILEYSDEKLSRLIEEKIIQ